MQKWHAPLDNLNVALGLVLTSLVVATPYLQCNTNNMQRVDHLKSLYCLTLSLALAESGARLDIETLSAFHKARVVVDWNCFGDRKDGNFP